MPRRFLYAPVASHDNNIGDLNKRCVLYQRVLKPALFGSVDKVYILEQKAAFWGKLTNEFSGESANGVGLSDKANFDLYIRTRNDVGVKDKIKIGKLWFDVANIQYLLDTQHYTVLGLVLAGEEDIKSVEL